MAELQEVLATKRPGDKVKVSYLHKKSKKTADVTLKNEQGNTKVVKDADLDVLGAQIREVNEKEKEEFGIKYGLKITKVNNGKFKEHGVPAGFILQNVNDEAMKTVDDLNEAVKAANKSKDPVLMLKGIYPSGKKGYFAVPLAE